MPTRTRTRTKGPRAFEVALFARFSIVAAMVARAFSFDRFSVSLLAIAVATAGVACTNRVEVGTYEETITTLESVKNTRKPLRLAAGGSSTCAIAPSGGVVCWGGNEYGELGTGSASPVKSAVPVPVKDSASGVVALSGSAFAYCALSSDGRSRCWGDSVFGETSLNAGEPKGIHRVWYLPLDVYNLEDDVTALRSGLYYGAALTADGRIRTWGLDGKGQLGQGARPYNLIPADVPVANVRFVDVAASPSGYFTCGVASAGDVYCWGANERGQLGDGTFVDRTTPVKVTGLGAKALEVTCGRSHACARTEGGLVACWGNAELGQLGQGAGPARSEARVITSLADVVEVRAGNDHSCARLGSHEVQCWGSDDAGQLSGAVLGTNDRGPRMSLHAPFGAESIAAGGKHSCAIAGGQVRCWGSNTANQRGDNGAFEL